MAFFNTSWQSPVTSGESDVLDTFLDTLTDFDTSYTDVPRAPDSEIEGDYGDSTKKTAKTNDTKVLTIMASIGTILSHLETERKKGNTRPSVAIKLKDVDKQKSITFSIPVLHSPTTTAASSMSSRSPSPETFPGEEVYGAHNDIVTPPEDAVPHKLVPDPTVMTHPSAVPDGYLWSLPEDASSSTFPVLATAYPEQAIASPPESLTPSATKADSSVFLNENTGSVIVRHRGGTSLAHPDALWGEIGQDMSPRMTILTVDHPQAASKLSQISRDSVAASSKKRSNNDAFGKSDQGKRTDRKPISSESPSGGIVKQPRLETPELATLLHNTDEAERVKEMTAGQDPTLVYKMVRNARAILPQSSTETPMFSTAINNDTVIPYNASRHSYSLQEDVMRQFCNTVRQIEWAETLTFQSMVQYRVLFVQLYQQYLSFQKILDTNKGERRVTAAKERLYKMLYPDKAKKSKNGSMSAEWEKLNRCIRRGKQWYTVASQLGIGILHRMPSSIRHTWVEQKLQTKTQLYLWIGIIKLLA